MRSALWMFAVLGVACRPSVQEGNVAQVGVVLPFSGERAAAGANIEKALILVQEAVNAGGGIAGNQLELTVADSHSDATRAKAAAQHLVDDQQVKILVGPEEATATLGLVALVVEKDLIQMQASLTSPAIVGPDTLHGHWYRLTPDATATGEALAQRSLADGVVKSTVLYDNDDYNIALSIAYTSAFQQLGGTIVPAVPFVRGTADYSTVISSLSRLGVDHVVLPAAPGSAVDIVEQWRLNSEQNFTWYFSPGLKTPLFAQNLPKGVADGIVGISPALGSDAESFAQTYATRWAGERPLDASSYYYDALAVIALAWASASKTGLATNAEIRPQIATIAKPTGAGLSVNFSNLSDGIAAANAGQPIVYRGVTGDFEFDNAGVAQRGANAFQFWTVRDRTIDVLE